MDSKRKADGSGGTDAEDRSSKRRKVTDFDLSKGESKDSTAAYGMAFVDQLRRTMDKSGRKIATYFEKLLPRSGNADYYKKTPLPISLETIEEKLNNGDFKNLAELESYFKRMIANAKEYYPRSSAVFDDAERVRKALSNYMTKNNPAYSKRGYQALPTPLPDEQNNDEEEEEEEEEEQDDENADQDEDVADDQDEEDEDEEEDDGRRRRSIILKRSSSGRPRRSSAYQGTPKQPPAPAKPDHEYEDIPYKGLSFQEAQEKVVEELLRHQEPEYDDAYFEPFVNLPPRALRDYYRIISDPLSLKKLQKMVKGVVGRGEMTGVSEFKTWAAFEEKSKLLWTNAFFYNEEGSEIYALAQELEKVFYSHLKKAQAAAPEHGSAKIKLKLGQGTDTPNSKKVTIHVGGRGDSVESPAPGVDTPTTNGDAANGTAKPSPSPAAGLKGEGAGSASPAVGTPAPQQPVAQVPPPPPSLAHLNEPRRPRGRGKGISDALISRLRIQAHPGLQFRNPDMGAVLPDPNYLQQSGVINVPAGCNRVFIVTMLPQFLHERHYSMWTLIERQPLKPYPHTIPGQQPSEVSFEVMLQPGVNVIEAHLIAAIPGDERHPGGPETELEVLTAFVNVMKA